MKKIIFLVMFISSATLILLSNNNKIYHDSEQRTDAQIITSEGVVEHTVQENVSSIFSTRNSGFYVTADNVVHGFGKANLGQLGNGKRTDIAPYGNEYETIPVNMLSSTNATPDNGYLAGTSVVKKISGGDTSTNILTASNIIYTVGGNNSWGALGTGNSCPYNAIVEECKRLQPVQTTPVTDSSVGIPADRFFNDGTHNVLDIVSGNYHTLILVGNGRVWSYGNNSYGQVGNGKMPGYDVNSSSANGVNINKYPVKIANNDGYIFNNTDGTVITDIAAAGNTSYMLSNTGIVWAFGQNTNNIINGTSDLTIEKPTKIPNANGFMNNGTTKIIDIEAGGQHLLMLDANGFVWAQGRNNLGQLGINSTADVSRAIKVANANGFINGETEVKKIYATENISAILTTDNRLYTFGQNNQGQLGIGNNTQKVIAPTLVADNYGFENGKSVIKDVKLLSNSILILLEDNSIYSVGLNNLGQLGNGNIDNINKVNLMSSTNQHLDIVGTGIKTSGAELKTQTIKYNSDVSLNNFRGQKLEIKKVGETTYTDITSHFNTNNSYIVGSSGAFVVNTNEEKAFEVKITAAYGAERYQSFIIDKKPPQLVEVLELGEPNSCNKVGNNVYCNSNIDLNSPDISGIYSIILEIDGVPTDLTTEYTTNGFITLTFENTIENEFRTYTLIDNAGNEMVIFLIKDNVPPKEEIK